MFDEVTERMLDAGAAAILAQRRWNDLNLSDRYLAEFVYRAMRAVAPDSVPSEKPPRYHREWWIVYVNQITGMGTCSAQIADSLMRIADELAEVKSRPGGDLVLAALDLRTFPPTI